MQMAKTCKGCGATLQNEDSSAIGYTPDLKQDYCQRCYRIRHYGDVTINLQQGIETNRTLEKINETEGTVFWIVDLFNLESGLISRLNRKLPGKDIVMILTKRDVLPSTLGDQKILDYVRGRLKDEGTQVKDIILAGHMLKKDDESKEILGKIRSAMHHAKGNAVIFMGAANAGKSTLINRIMDREDLTTSRNPGTTLDLVPMEWEGMTVYDTPGLENIHSVLSWILPKDLKTVIPVKPIKPLVTQIYEDQSFAAGGLARLDVVCDGKATVVGYFSRSLPVHRGKLSDADRLWNDHLGEMLSPSIDTSMLTMHTYTAPALKPGEKMDIVIQGLGWFCVSGDVKKIYVRVHKGIYVTFRKAMI